MAECAGLEIRAALIATSGQGGTYEDGSGCLGAPLGVVDTAGGSSGFAVPIPAPRPKDPLDLELDTVVQAWTTLPTAIRAGILAMIRAST